MPSATANGNSLDRAETPIQVDDALTQALTPLLALRDQMKAEEAEMQAALEEKRKEVRRVERVLREGEIIPRAQTKPPKSNKSRTGPIGSTPRAQEAVERIRVAIKSFEGEPFQFSMLEERSKSTRDTLKKALKLFNDEGWVRLVGMRPQLNRKTGAPGGRMAETHQEIID